MKPQEVAPTSVRNAAVLLDILLVDTISAMAQFAVIAESKETLPNRRLGSSITLARASCDFGRAIAVLVSTDHEELGAPALALLRSQLELTLRSAFFGFHANVDEVETFFQKDKLKRRPPDKEKMQDVPLEELVKIVESTWVDDDRISTSVGLLRQYLNAHVHGGISLLAAYQGSDGIGFVTSDSKTLQTLRYSYAFANLAMIVVAKLSSEDTNLASELFDKPYRSAQDFLAVAGLE